MLTSGYKIIQQQHLPKNTMPNSALMDLVDKSMGGDNVVSRRSCHVGNYEVLDIASKISSFYKCIKNGDLSKLQALQETILQMDAPFSLIHELKSIMKISRIPWPGDEGDERWNQAWRAIKKVWASKWNERAVISCRKAKLDHENVCMAVLIQESICADYAFVIHTKNPLSGNAAEIYTETVKGLGDTLVGAYPGRAMSFITQKSNLNFPIVNGYPSKPIGLYSKQSIIFRSDSNVEDLEGLAGAGLYDSVIMDKEEKIVLDYLSDRMINDRAFQVALLSRIAEAGKIIEGLYGCPQDQGLKYRSSQIYREFKKKIYRQMYRYRRYFYLNTI